VQLSSFAERFCGTSAVVELMQDLEDALDVHPQMVFMGGGNPARIEALELLYRERLASLLADPDRFHEALGVYQSPQGDAGFRTALAAMLQAEYSWPVTAANIAVANGSQSAFFILFNLFGGAYAGGQHKRIQLPLVPEYIGYRELGLSEAMFHSERPAIELLPDALFKYRVDFQRLRIDGSAGAICVSRPTNPTGNVLSDVEMDTLDRLARAQGIPLIVDAAYGTPFPCMVFDAAPPRWNDNTILVLSLSKLGLPGLRTGIVVANEQVTEAFTRANTVFSLACGSLGPALARDMIESGDLLRLSREHIRPFYRDKAQRSLDQLRAALGDLPCRIHKPEGAMFLWLWCDKLPGGSQALYRRLKQRGVLVVPGDSFFPGLEQPWSHRAECLRISYAQDDALVRRGISIIADELRRSYGGG